MIQWMYRLLGKSKVYESFQAFVSRSDGFGIFIQEFVRPSKGDRIVDFGCGPAVILRSLLKYDVDYCGVDFNPDYISAAQREFQGQHRVRWICGSVDAPLPLEEAGFDIALSAGVLHHLNDQEAEALIFCAWRSLKPGGLFVTHDGAFVRGQHPVATLLLKLDRGKHVRTPEQYDKMLGRHFPRVEGKVEHGRLRIPYTHYMARCYKE